MQMMMEPVCGNAALLLKILLEVRQIRLRGGNVAGLQILTELRHGLRNGIALCAPLCVVLAALVVLCCWLGSNC